MIRLRRPESARQPTPALTRDPSTVVLPRANAVDLWTWAEDRARSIGIPLESFVLLTVADRRDREASIDVPQV